METAPATEPRKESRRFQAFATLSMAVVAVWAAIVGALQNHASNRQAEANDRNQERALSAVGELLRAEQETAHELDLYTRWYEAYEQANQARAAAQAARLQGNADSVAAHEASAARWDAATAELESLSPILSDPRYNHNDQIYREQTSRAAYMEIERQEAAGREYQDWGSKADTFVAVLTILAVVLFLFGLSLTIEGGLRFMFMGVGWALAGATGLWVLIVAVVPVHVTPEEAMAHLVEGQIASNIGYYQTGEAKVEWYARAVDELTQAIDLDPRYASAYEWRGQSQLDARLRDRAFDNAAAMADYRRAIQLGDDNALSNTNLGWAAFLAGDYDAAIRASRRAVEQDATQCVAHLNHGLALLASGEAGEANAAYDAGIACIMDGPVRSRARLFDAAIADLTDLKYIYPDTPGVDDALRRFKELSAAYALFGGISLRSTDAQVESVRFAENVGQDDVPLDVTESFIPGTPIVYAFFTYSGIEPDTAWLVRWYRDGELYDTYTASEWIYDGSGEVWTSVAGLPMPAGRYEVDFYFNGHLRRTASFEVQAGEAVAMEPYISSAFHLSLNLPVGWTASETAGDDGSLIISRDESTYLYHFVLPDYAGTTDDLLADMRSIWETNYPGVEFGEPGTFYLGRKPGAVYQHAWHDADGVPVITYLIGHVDDAGLARVFWLQMPQDGSDDTYAQFFLPMLKSIAFAD